MKSMIGINNDTKCCFLDTNIWLYAFIESDNVLKRETAKTLIKRLDVVVSAQVINETCVNLLKKASLSEMTIRQLISAFFIKSILLSASTKAH